MDVKEIKKRMEEKSAQFESLLSEKVDLEGRISLLNEELLRMQGEYRMLKSFLPEEEKDEE
jgi:predicted nuclease with TOPRIM domain